MRLMLGKDQVLTHFLMKTNIGHTMKPRSPQDLDTHKKLYKHPHAKCKGFQGDLNCYA